MNLLTIENIIILGVIATVCFFCVRYFLVFIEVVEAQINLVNANLNVISSSLDMIDARLVAMIDLDYQLVKTQKELSVIDKQLEELR